tara:strand:- start:479 stop:1018 length:540 start_codon:yes stop_codon:yes gene_type:complete
MLNINYSRIEIDFDFYSKYHSHYLNKIVHIIFIPLICFSLFIFLNYIPLSLDIYTTSFNIFNFRPSFILYLLYMIYYCYNSISIGLFCIVFYFIILLASNLFYYNIEYSYVYAIIFQIISWIAQIASHKYIEGNSPAFKDGFIQSFLTAPMFIVVEILEIITKKIWIRRIINTEYSSIS